MTATTEPTRKTRVVAQQTDDITAMKAIYRAIEKLDMAMQQNVVWYVLNQINKKIEKEFATRDTGKTGPALVSNGVAARSN